MSYNKADAERLAAELSAYAARGGMMMSMAYLGEVGRQLRGAIEQVDAERAKANEWLTQLHDARKERDEARATAEAALAVRAAAYEGRRVCPGCDHEIDEETCWCGEDSASHNQRSGHSPVPMGCRCHDAAVGEP